MYKVFTPELDSLFDHMRYYSISTYLKRIFGSKTIKLAIDGGFTCPNRDGTKGYGGCTFCSDSGSGEFSSNIEAQISLYENKWPNSNYLAYFQNHTNTYAPVSELSKKYYSVLENSKIKGLVIGTRADCLSEEVLELLSEINEKHFLWVEIGLQTIHEKTAQSINRCYPLETFETAYKKLQEKGIKTVVHLILGLPGESKEMMLESVKYVSSLPNLFGIKLHLLNIVKGSAMALTHPDYVPFSSIEEYVNLVVDCLEIIPETVTIHRMTGDCPRPLLINPKWSYRKRTILNGINERLNLLDSFQGKKKT